MAFTAASGQTFTNGSFSTGDLTGWQTSGMPTVLTIDGTPQALINTTITATPPNPQPVEQPSYYQPAAAASAAALNTFLGGTLPPSQQGAAYNGQAIQQSFTTTEGATVSFSYSYQSREAPGNGFDETGYVVNGVFHILGDTFTPNQAAANVHGFFNTGTTYKTVTFTVGPGTTHLGFVAYNTVNGASNSGLYISNVTVTPLAVPQTAALTAPTGFSAITPNAISGSNIVGYNFTSEQAVLYNTTTSTATSLVPSGSVSSIAYGVSGNNAVGYYSDTNGIDRAFFYNGSVSEGFGPSGLNQDGYAVSGTNYAGVYSDFSGHPHVFLYDGSSYTTFTPIASGTNTVSGLDGTTVVGEYSPGNGLNHGFMYVGSTLTTIDPTGSVNTIITGISGSTVVGYYTDASTSIIHGFTYNKDNATLTYPIDVPVANVTATQITAISGTNLTGYYTVGSNSHGFFYDGTAFTLFDYPGGTNTKPTGISGSTIVGSSSLGGFIATMTPGKSDATVTFDELFGNYTGSAQPATATTVPAGLTTTITYNGSATPPTLPGDYTVVATVNDATYQGSTTTIYTIPKVDASVSLTTPTFTYDQTPKSATSETTPNGLNVTYTYEGNATPPTNAGSYYVFATIDDPVYQGTTSGTLTINQVTASLALGGLAAIYDGTPKSATALTTPAGINVAFTYAGSSTPPIAIGSYAVVGTIADLNYLPTTANGTLVISPGAFQDWTTYYNVGGPTDTPQNDSVPNLLKYLYAIDPTQPITPTDQTALPVYGNTTINGTNYLTLTYRQNHNALDLQIQPQSSTDLQSWSLISDSNFPLTIRTDSNGDLFKQYGVPITGTRQFIRLHVIAP